MMEWVWGLIEVPDRRGKSVFKHRRNGAVYLLISEIISELVSWELYPTAQKHVNYTVLV